MIIDGVNIETASKRELEILHWRLFGIWMKKRSQARKTKKWGKVHAYARDVLDPIMARIEIMGEEE